ALGDPAGLSAWQLALFLCGAVALVAAATARLSGKRRALSAVLALATVAALATEVTAAARADARASRLARSLPVPHALPGGQRANGVAVSIPAEPAAGEIGFWNPRATVLDPPLSQRSVDP